MSEAIKRFSYMKESGEKKSYELLKLKEGNSNPITFLEGISLGELPEDQRKEILDALSHIVFPLA